MLDLSEGFWALQPGFLLLTAGMQILYLRVFVFYGGPAVANVALSMVSGMITAMAFSAAMLVAAQMMTPLLNHALRYYEKHPQECLVAGRLVGWSLLGLMVLSMVYHFL